MAPLVARHIHIDAHASIDDSRSLAMGFLCGSRRTRERLALSSFVYICIIRGGVRERAKEFNANASRDVELFVRLRVANGEARRDGVCAVFSQDEKKMFVQGERTLLWIGANDFFPLFQLVVGVYSVLLWGL